MNKQNKEIIEIKLVFAMVKLAECIKKSNDNEGEIKELIHDLRIKLDDFANLFVKKDGEK